MLIRILLITAVLCLAAAGFADDFQGQWVAGIIHGPHATDGTIGCNATNILKKVRDENCHFLIETDHYNNLKRNKKGFDLSNYKQKFACNDLVVICGLEVEKNWSGGKAHALILGDIERMYLSRLKEQWEATAKLKDGGCLTFAAHPCNGTYPFDLNDTEYLDGVEFFNDNFDHTSLEGYLKTREFYKSLIKSHRRIAVSSGCDAHFLFSNVLSKGRFSQQMFHKTYIFNVSENLTIDSVLRAIANGRTYAAWGGVSLKNLNYIPSFEPKDIEKPCFQFMLSYEDESLAERNLQIYRDGELVKSSIKKIPVGVKEFVYAWEDKEASTGVHWYFIELEGVLVTSPIIINTKKVAPGISQIFKEIAIQVYKGPGSGMFGGHAGCGYRTHNFDPVIDRQQIFKGKTFAEIYVIFKTRDIIEGQNCSQVSYGFNIEVIGPRNNSIYNSASDFYSQYSWRTGWVVFTTQMYEPGQYKIIVKDTNHNILQTKCINVQ